MNRLNQSRKPRIPVKMTIVDGSPSSCVSKYAMVASGRGGCSTSGRLTSLCEIHQGCLSWQGDFVLCGRVRSATEPSPLFAVECNFHGTLEVVSAKSIGGTSGRCAQRIV
jgi:hypothetical protein